MPRRTTEFQTIVHFVRKHTAGAGVTVTESRLLRDKRLGVDREVDIVVEGTFDGEPSVTSIEVIEHARPAPVTWVEQQIAKHRYLPTNRLVLVSQSGYSKTALQAVAVEGGWVDALHPMILTEDGEPVVKRLYADSIDLRPTVCRLVVEPKDGQPLIVRVAPDHTVFDGGGQPIDSTLRLAQEVLRLEWLVHKFLMSAHGHPDRENLKGFSVGLPLRDYDYYLHKEESDQLHRIIAMELTGEFIFTQDELAFQMTRIGGRVFGSGRGPLFGRDAVWVGTTDDDAQKTTISWKALDATGNESGRARDDVTRRRFPGLLELTPGEWTDQEVEDAIIHVSQRRAYDAPLDE
jgi:hypothetical protein